MFGFLRKKKKDPVYIAAEHTDTPMSSEMTRLVAQELPLLDSVSRTRVYRLLEEYDGPTITAQEELPQEIRDLMDLEAASFALRRPRATRAVAKQKGRKTPVVRGFSGISRRTPGARPSVVSCGRE